MKPMLVVDDLIVALRTPKGLSRPVDGVSFLVMEGEMLAMVGESGCGKTLTALAILQVLPEPGSSVERGRVLLEGEDLLDLTWSEMRRIRGRRIGMVFQEPMTSLNPVFTVGAQVAEAMEAHGVAAGAEARKKAVALLDQVRLPRAAQVARQYPHELSGGMRQRVSIAMAIASRPRLLIADEPTTALDASVAKGILELLAELRRSEGMAVLLITHDLAKVIDHADRVAVMYAGRIVETGLPEDVFRFPAHPYTAGLAGCRPSASRRGSRLPQIPGSVPSPLDRLPGCRFAPRCPIRTAKCEENAPVPVLVSPGREAACYFATGSPGPPAP